MRTASFLCTAFLCLPAIGLGAPDGSRTVSGWEVLAWFGIVNAAAILAALLASHSARPRFLDRLRPRKRVEMRLRLRAEPSELATVQDALDRFGRARHIGIKAIFDVNMAVEEMLGVMLAGREDEAPEVDFLFRAEPGQLRVSLAVSGSVPNPLESRPELLADRRERRSRGADRDLFHLRRYMDALSFRREGEVSVFSAVRRFDPEQRKRLD